MQGDLATRALDLPFFEWYSLRIRSFQPAAMMMKTQLDAWICTRNGTVPSPQLGEEKTPATQSVGLVLDVAFFQSSLPQKLLRTQ